MLDSRLAARDTQSAGDVKGPWSPVAGATTPYTNAITGGNRFFRVLVQ